METEHVAECALGGVVVLEEDHDLLLGVVGRQLVSDGRRLLLSQLRLLYELRATVGRERRVQEQLVVEAGREGQVARGLDEYEPVGVLFAYVEYGLVGDVAQLDAVQRPDRVVVAAHHRPDANALHRVLERLGHLRHHVLHCARLFHFELSI